MRIFSALVSGENDVDELIQAAIGPCEVSAPVRRDGDDCGARATEAEAERWERLAHAAQNELRSFAGTAADAARGDL
jgi:hypothetical protein